MRDRVVIAGGSGFLGKEYGLRLDGMLLNTGRVAAMVLALRKPMRQWV